MKKSLGLLVLLCAGAAHSATVTQCGTTICYQYDDAQVAAGSGYFGTPTLIGNDMRFLPTAYRAESIDGVGDHTATNTDILSSTFVFDRIYTVSGAEIANITYTERGDYRINVDGSVQADMLMLIANNNDAAECDCVLDSFGTSGNSALALWQLSGSFDAANSFNSLANDVSLSLQNTLYASTDAAGENAWIQKKFMTVSVTAVPVPAAVWLFGSALALLGFRSRKPAA